MIAKIVELKTETKVVTVISYLLEDKDGHIIGAPERELIRYEPFSDYELEARDAKQVTRNNNYSVKSVGVKVNFSEDTFSEDYTFFVDVTDPINEEINESNLEERIQKRIEEELIIYKNRKQADSDSEIKLSIQVGDITESK